MVLYTVLAWTVIVIAVGSYYWVYIRQKPFPVDLLGFSTGSHSRESADEGEISISSSQKRKRKIVAAAKNLVSKTTEPLTGSSGFSGDDGAGVEAKSFKQAQGKSTDFTEKKPLKVDIEPLRKLEVVYTSSDADESDALDTPTPVPSKKQFAKLSFSPHSAQSKNAAESRLERVIPRTVVDDMIPQEDRPAVARVLRISSSSKESVSSSPAATRTGSSRAPAVDKDGLTKKQRQNRKKKERQREARAREETIRQEQLRAHQKELETIRLNSQIKEAEKKSAQINVWQHTGRPTMEDSVYTIRNLSEENLTTVGHRSDGAMSEEGWQEVTSRATKKQTFQKTSAEKTTSGTDASEELSSFGDSEEGPMLKVRPVYVSSNSFANLDS